MNLTLMKRLPRLQFNQMMHQIKYKYKIGDPREIPEYESSSLGTSEFNTEDFKPNKFLKEKEIFVNRDTPSWKGCGI